MNPEALDNFELVMVTDFYPLDFLYKLNDILRSKNKALIVTACAGLLGFVFTDFGEQHIIFDKTGEALKHSLISKIFPDGVVSIEEGKRHDLEEGD